MLLSTTGLPDPAVIPHHPPHPPPPPLLPTPEVVHRVLCGAKKRYDFEYDLPPKN